jgi:hypothetical protein
MKMLKEAFERVTKLFDLPTASSASTTEGSSVEATEVNASATEASSTLAIEASSATVIEGDILHKALAFDAVKVEFEDLKAKFDENQEHMAMLNEWHKNLKEVVVNNKIDAANSHVDAKKLSKNTAAAMEKAGIKE